MFLAGLAIFTVVGIPLACIAWAVQAVIRAETQEAGLALPVVLRIAFGVLGPLLVIWAISTMCRTPPAGK